MKINFKILILPFLLIMLCCANAYAFPITAGQTLKFTEGDYRQGSGGEFRLTDTSSGASYLSFCVEVGEYINLGSSYYVNNVSTIAYNGGVGPQGDEISDASQWLIGKWMYDYSYLTDNISGLGAKSDSIAELVQKAIWHFEDESGYLGYSNVFTTLLNNTNFNDGSNWISTPWLDASVQVVNFVEGSTLKQSQLVATPEPGTIMLLGVGLLGIVGAGRKKLFKK